MSGVLDLQDLRTLVGRALEDAGKSLSCMLDGASIAVGAPSVVSAAAGPSKQTGRGVSVAFDVHGAADQRLVFLMGAATEGALVHALLGEHARDSDAKLLTSSIEETGNILACAFLKTIGDVLDTPLPPSPPLVWRGDLAQLHADVLENVSDEIAILGGLLCASAGIELHVLWVAALELAAGSGGSFR